MKASIRILCGAAVLGLAAMAQAEVAVIVNPAAAKAPSQSDVANIFLGKDKSMKGIDQAGWTPAKEAFYAGVTSKNESQLKSYWSGLIFTGKGTSTAVSSSAPSKGVRRTAQRGRGCPLRHRSDHSLRCRRPPVRCG